MILYEKSNVSRKKIITTEISLATYLTLKKCYKLMVVISVNTYVEISTQKMSENENESILDCVEFVLERNKKVSDEKKINGK